MKLLTIEAKQQYDPTGNRRTLISIKAGILRFSLFLSSDMLMKLMRLLITGGEDRFEVYSFHGGLMASRVKKNDMFELTPEFFGFEDGDPRWSPGKTRVE